MTRILLVRHGQTDAIDHYLPGTASGTPLNAMGHGQVRHLADQLARMPLTAVVSSPLTRTRETAEAIAAPHGLNVQISPAFMEFEIGEWTGRQYRELDQDAGWRRFNATRSMVRPPGGELMIEVQARAIAALLDLARRHPDGTIAIVSHGDVIRSMLMYFLGVPFDLVHRLEISPARISVVAIDRDSPVVVQVNAATIDVD